MLTILELMQEISGLLRIINQSNVRGSKFAVLPSGNVHERKR
jgi:hypothetical protein